MAHRNRLNSSGVRFPRGPWLASYCRANTMATRINLNDVAEGAWLEINEKAKNAVVEYMTENPDLTFSEASEEVIGVDITQG